MGGSFVMVFIGYFLFINITFAVIMCMDMMECFLHALRLQWYLLVWMFLGLSFRTSSTKLTVTSIFLSIS